IANEEVLHAGDEEGEGARLFTLYDGACACFCGHSHRNDFYFIRGGVTFAYGRATGAGGYGDDVPKGAKLIELATGGGRRRFKTVFPDGTEWSPGLQCSASCAHPSGFRSSWHGSFSCGACG